MMAFVEVAKIRSNGKPLVGCKVKAFTYEHSVGYARTWMGWFDYATLCDCKVDDTTSPEVWDGTTKASLHSAVSPACRAIVAGGDMQSVKAGDVCVETVEAKLVFTFVACIEEE
jgi:hypothetical protein